MKKLMICLAALLPAPLLAGALDELKAFYARAEVLAADFEQRLVDEDGETLERYAGRLWIQRPDRFLWRYDSPYPLELGSDGERLWHYDVDLQQATLRDAAASLSGTPAELLGGDFSRLQRYVIEELGAAKELQWLSLRPREDDGDFAHIRIGLREGQPAQILLDDRLGQTTRILLHDLRINPALDRQHFQLKLPEGVTIVDERAPS